MSNTRMLFAKYSTQQSLHVTEVGKIENKLYIYMGQAGGTAAAMCAKSGVEPRDLNVEELQKKLLAEGFYLGDEKRLAELGLKQ